MLSDSNNETSKNTDERKPPTVVSTLDHIEANVNMLARAVSDLKKALSNKQKAILLDVLRDVPIPNQLDEKTLHELEAATCRSQHAVEGLIQTMKLLPECNMDTID